MADMKIAENVDDTAKKYCPQRSLRPILTVDLAWKISSAPKALVLHLPIAFPIRALAVCPVDSHPLLKKQASQLIAGVIASRKTTAMKGGMDG